MQYNVIVIGSGPGGYVAAIRCAQLGFKTAIIEKYNTLGGTCLNVGCIPSKALLDSSEHFVNAKNHFKEHGIDIPSPKVNFTQMIKRKEGVVKSNVDGIAYLMKKNKIEVYQGVGAFVDNKTIKVTATDGKVTTITTDKIIIATGSKPTPLPFAPFDKKRIISSTESLALKEVPKRLIVVGGGVIGMELGSVYARLGSKVIVVEFLESLIPTMDGTMGKELLKATKKLDMEFYLGHKVTSLKNNGREVILKAEGKDGKTLELKGDYCLVSIGRRPYTDGLALDKVGIETVKGQIPVDDHLKTKADNIYAIGDVVRGPMLAHKAEEEGVYVAEQMDGQKPHINYLLIPGVVYTWPEVASVGYTEEQLKEQGRGYKTGSFPYKALGRARASMDTDGLVKVLADKQTDEILGMHIIGARAADMIAAGVTAMEFRASAEDISRMSHAHPTYMEAVKEACLAATANRPLHM
ncbi:MAG: dihydrolipoyl dehydrogenase [Cyclobacteriaceae bacterium]|nr:dihydrolipoyl dehydrogenase [Cyclobacteriaceae bacterium]MDH4297930.1 dihydrolipoyl dehydrogenase [Cyclobacteriaceae bacterium]MDH5247948.1 dihydrolipoyl dehydrogenase [Cyclobacteriaceae bacterium]